MRRGGTCSASSCCDSIGSSRVEISSKLTIFGNTDTTGVRVRAGAEGSSDLAHEEEGKRRAVFYNTPFPPTCPKVMVAEPSGTTFSLRGFNYMKDRKKVPSEENFFRLCCVDLFESIEKTVDICSRPDNRVAMARQRGDNNWYFVMNIMVPLKKKNFSYVVYWEGDRSKIDSEETPFGRIAKPFFDGADDAYRNSRFKLIPRVVEGPYVVKMAVGQKPALLGHKLTQHYIRGDNYFEIDIDVSSSVIANNTVGMALSSSKSLRVDMGITLQGNEEEELPEVACCLHSDQSGPKPSAHPE